MVGAPAGRVVRKSLGFAEVAFGSTVTAIPARTNAEDAALALGLALGCPGGSAWLVPCDCYETVSQTA
jgi:hypothetical protein